MCIRDRYSSDKKLREHAIMRLVESSKNQGKFSECLSYSKKYSDELDAELQNRVELIALKCEASYKEVLKNEDKEKS